MSDPIEELLTHRSPDVQRVSRALRMMVTRAAPEAHELLYHGALCYSLRESHFEPFCYIAPRKSYVNLGFFFGAHLPDPERLMQGQGSRMRHVKVETADEANSAPLEALVKAAWADAPDIYANLRTKERKRRGKAAKDL